MKQNIAVITGVAGGIGKILARDFIKAGYIVVGIDIVQPDNCDNYFFIQTDISSYSEVKKAFEKIKERYGSVQILINNAAIANCQKDITQVNPDEFHHIINTNLCGSFYCVKEFLILNANCGYGRIINISSTRFNQNESGWEAYGASKGGLISLTNSLAISLSCTGITVNAISPGWIETKHYNSLTESDHIQHPSGRVGIPEDISRTALFLCDKRNNFINAQNIDRKSVV